MFPQPVTIYVYIPAAGKGKTGLMNNWQTSCVPTVGGKVGFPYINSLGGISILTLKVQDVLYIPRDPEQKENKDEPDGVVIKVFLNPADITEEQKKTLLTTSVTANLGIWKIF